MKTALYYTSFSRFPVTQRTDMATETATDMAGENSN
jgi:hypothetical protein